VTERHQSRGVGKRRASGGLLAVLTMSLTPHAVNVKSAVCDRDQWCEQRARSDQIGSMASG